MKSEDDEDDEVEEDEDDGAGKGSRKKGGAKSKKVPARQPGEFTCRSCFLVKHPNQLADAKAMLCKDCV